MNGSGDIRISNKHYFSPAEIHQAQENGHIYDKYPNADEV